jgi:AcrR family transcriptional regulator
VARATSAAPRRAQKARTRAAIIEAAQQLSRRGGTPSIAEAGERAGVSRATAYRYFPTQEALQVELADVSPRVTAVEEAIANLSSQDVERRLLALLDTFAPITLAEEEHFRRALHVYQDTWLRSRRDGGENPPAVREGRRVRWLDAVLEPLALPDARRRRLRSALALTLGIDSLVVMKDVCGLDDKEALDVLRWTAETLLRAEDSRSQSSPSADFRNS